MKSIQRRIHFHLCIYDELSSSVNTDASELTHFTDAPNLRILDHSRRRVEGDIGMIYGGQCGGNCFLLGEGRRRLGNGAMGEFNSGFQCY